MPRLIVRLQPWSEPDLPLLVRLNAPEMMRHLGGPEAEDQVLKRHRRYVDAVHSDSSHVFKVVVSPGRCAVGQVAFWERTWQDEAVYEMGWSVIPEHQGQGIGSRAAALALARARKAGKHRFVHAFPSIDNAASNATCRRLGFALLGECDFEYPPGHEMRCSDWRFDLEAGPAGGSTHT